MFRLPARAGESIFFLLMGVKSVTVILRNNDISLSLNRSLKRQNRRSLKTGDFIIGFRDAP